MQKIPFSKMHGAGNDYIYFNCLENEIQDPQELARTISPRRFGVGADGIVLILPSEIADFRMRMFNADGSEAEMCGNATRCVAKFLYEKQLSSLHEIRLETLAGIKVLKLYIENEKVSSVRVNMGAPILNAKEIPVDLDAPQVMNYPLQLEGQEFLLNCVSFGNPHAVIFVDKITDEQVLHWGPKIEVHPFFPQKVNVEFVEVLAPNEMRMRVWERGSGETYACGTGAAAVIVAAVLNEKTERKALIHLKGGDLELEWAEDGCVYKTGPATFVYDGQITI